MFTDPDAARSYTTSASSTSSSIGCAICWEEASPAIFIQGTSYCNEHVQPLNSPPPSNTQYVDTNEEPPIP